MSGKRQVWKSGNEPIVFKKGEQHIMNIKDCSSIGSLQARWENRKEAYLRKGAFFSVETAFYFIVIAIVAALIIGIFTYLDDARVATAQQELDQIRSAVLEYKAYRLDQSVPSELPTLLESGCISADDSIDNRRHGPFLNTTNNRWTSDGLKDPWGNNYEISSDSDSRGTYVYSTCGGKGTDEYLRVYISVESITGS